MLYSDFEPSPQLGGGEEKEDGGFGQRIRQMHEPAYIQIYMAYMHTNM